MRNSLLALAVVAAAVANAVVWLGLDVMRQRRLIDTLLINGLLAIGLLLWVLSHPRLSWKARGVVVLGLTAVVAAGAGLVRVEQVSGDLVPTFAWRWSPKPDELLEALPCAPEEDTVSSEMQVLPSPGDYPQFLGPRRNATVEGVVLARDWSARPPRLLWRQPIGAGWSSFAVVGELAFTQEQRGAEELVVCYDVTTGEVVWTHADAARFGKVISGDGPRATPTVADGRVFTLGATGILNCLEAASGQPRWQRNVLADAKVGNKSWGTSCSPLVVGDLVIVSTGGRDGKSLLAYGSTDGAPVWAGGDSPSSYASPLLAEIDGVRQVVVLDQKSIAGHDLDTGAVLWEKGWTGDEPKASEPLVIDSGDEQRVLVSAGYGVGALLFDVARDRAGDWSTSVVWESRRLRAKFSNTIVHAGFAYGLDDGILVCLDLASGERRWKSGRYGHGQLLKVGDALLVTAESGEVALVEPGPDAHREVARFQAIEGKTWNHAAFSRGRLLVRNAGEAACYELPLVEP